MERSQGEQSIDIVVPTYREALNLELLIGRLRQLREKQGLPLRLTIVDDNSQDGTEELIAKINADWVRLIVRTEDRGLSSAVLEGIRRTDGDVIVVMDADLSHPPESIPAMLQELEHGSDFVVGSRYVEGGGTDDDWGFFRWLNSRVATLFARPFTAIKDPMSGFFALRRETYKQADFLNPVGYKIGLELLVKCHCKRATEVPIHFVDRVHGESKLSFKEQLRYIQHIRRLFLYKYGTWSEILQFLVVGASGVVVNLAALTLFLVLGLNSKAGIALAIFTSIVSNFLLNRRFTFSHSRDEYLPTQFLRYLVSVSFGSAVNYVVAVLILAAVPDLLPQLASLGGIACATLVNFITLKFLVFKKKHYRGAAAEVAVSADGEAMESMLEWRPVLSLGLVLTVFFYLATRFALQQSLWTDETTQLSGLSLGFADNLRWLTGALANPFPVPPDRMPPVAYWIGRVWKLLVGGEVLSMRYLSVAASAGAVIAVWFTGRRFFGPRAAFAASLLLAASPNLVVQSVEIRAYSLFLFFASLLVYYYLRAASVKLSQSRWDLWSFSAVAILCAFTHFYGVVIAVGGFISLFILAMLRAEDGRERTATLKAFVAPALVSGLFAIPLLPFVLAAVKVSGPAAADVVPARDYVHDLAKMIYRFYAHQTLRGLSGLNLLVPALGLALTLFACLIDRSQRARQLVVFLAVNVGLVATAGLLTRSFDVFTPSYNVWALPVVSLILASSLAHHAKPLWRNAALAGLVILLAGNLYGSVQLSSQGRFYAHSRSEDLRRTVESLGLENTSVVFVNDSPHTYFPLIYLFGKSLDLYQVKGGVLEAITPGRLGQAADLPELRKNYLILVGSEQLSADELQRDLSEGKDPAGAVKALGGFEAAQAGALAARWRLVDRYNLLSQSALAVAVYQSAVAP